MAKTTLVIGAHSTIGELLIDTLNQSGERVITISRELSSKGEVNFQVNRLEVDSLPDIEEEIDGLVYLPGTLQLQPHNKMTLEDYKRDMEINFFGATSCVNKYIENLKKASHGSIVFISTVAVKIGMPFHTSISGAKGALEGYARALSAELSPKICVNVVAPSLTNTHLTKHLLSTDEKIEAFGKKHPLQRIGDPEDIVNTVEFLLSKKSSFITGQVISTDGGYSSVRI